MRTLESLKNLAVKLGCGEKSTDVAGDTVDEVIDYISKNYKGGSGESADTYAEVEVTVDMWDDTVSGYLLDLSNYSGVVCVKKPDANQLTTAHAGALLAIKFGPMQCTPVGKMIIMGASLEKKNAGTATLLPNPGVEGMLVFGVVSDLNDNLFAYIAPNYVLADVPSAG